MDKKLNKEEAGMAEGLELGESILDPKLMKDLRASAREHLKERQKNKSLTLRIAEGDLEGIKHKAEQAGIPYQTLLNMLIHQYVDGRIKIVL